MTHEERYKLALEYSEKLAKELQNKLICCCLYGSTSRETDTKWSDLELFVVTKEEIPARYFLVNMIPVTIKTITENRLIAILKNPDKEWPFYAGLMKNLEVLSGDKEAPKRYFEKAMNVPENKFINAAKKNASEFVFESCGRIFSCVARKNYDDIFCAVIETLLEMRTVLCLLNHSFVNRDYFEGIKETFKFKKIPKNYPVLSTKLWQSRDPFEIARYARELLNNYVNMLKEERII
jgi:kanamycin nucleotidyltransferase